jgi:purine nucleosidase/non-specific riboncleoside hydrolase
MVQPIIDARHVHGDDGLGGATRPRYDDTPASRDGIGVMRRTLREAASRGETVDLMMIGPLTNLAFALKLEPAIIAGIGTLWVMGATVYGRGNTTTAAEFNIYADPEAAQIVLTAGIETIIAPYDACTEHVLSGADLDALHEATPQSAVRDFMKALSDHQRKLRIGWGRPDGILYVDPLAAAVCIAPDSITRSISASTAVVLDQGIARGMTLVDPANRLKTPRVTFVERADQRALDSIYARTIAYVPEKAFETT